MITPQSLACQALEINATLEKDGKPVTVSDPAGWMPPGKRHKIIKILEEISQTPDPSAQIRAHVESMRYTGPMPHMHEGYNAILDGIIDFIDSPQT